MIEHITLTVAELAVRWSCTIRQVFEQARHLRLLLYFPFDGLAYDVVEERRRAYEEWKENEEVGVLKRGMDASQKRLQRHTAGEVSEWEDSLSDEDAKSLQRELSVQAMQLHILAGLAESRQAERDRSRFLGDLVASPETVALCERDGSAPFPEIAYHPAGQLFLSKAEDGEYGILDGRMLRLGERRSTHDKLDANDLRARMVDIKTIEAVPAPAMMHVKRPASPPAPASPTTNDAAGNIVLWVVKKPRRAQGYNMQLYEYLKGEHAAGRPLPKPRNVLAAWMESKPADVTGVADDSFTYRNSLGQAEIVELKALGQAIGRMAMSVGPSLPSKGPTGPAND